MIQEQADLTLMNTFQIQAKARYYAEVDHPDTLKKIMDSEVFRTNKVLILGGGSNVIFTKDFDGLVIHPTLKGISVNSIGSGDQVLVTAAAGENWHGLVTYCVEKNLGGIENLALIPGNCGAAPIQNIGAYGRELADVVEWVDTIDLLTGATHRFGAEECQFGYRDSLFKHPKGKNFFISSITLRLTAKNHIIDASYSGLKEELQAMGEKELSIRDIYTSVVSVRKRKLPDPQVTGNAGSFFKNPVITKSLFLKLQHEHPTIPFYNIDNQLIKIPAAWLIEQAGWKGKHVGSVGVHARQALVIINLGGARGKEILEFSEHIQQDVLQQFGIQLEREVNII
ncbi:MAG: UDP-N-acetylenolpyruvoylglucosamine reductase [Bacteroidota bacterium]